MEVWRWPLADGFNVDDPASVADRSEKPACRCDGPCHWRPTDLSVRSTQLMQSEESEGSRDFVGAWFNLAIVRAS